MHENVRSLIIPFVLILNILLSSQWTICSVGVQWGYNEDTMWNTRGTVGVQEGYMRGTVGVQEGYSGGTVGVQWGYRRGTVWNTRGTVGIQ